jgi:hypothetical protein
VLSRLNQLSKRLTWYVHVLKEFSAGGSPSAYASFEDAHLGKTELDKTLSGQHCIRIHSRHVTFVERHDPDITPRQFVIRIKFDSR